VNTPQNNDANIVASIEFASVERPENSPQLL
jgi:hypothetical protein